MACASHNDLETFQISPRNSLKHGSLVLSVSLLLFAANTSQKLQYTRTEYTTYYHNCAHLSTAISGSRNNYKEVSS